MIGVNPRLQLYRSAFYSVAMSVHHVQGGRGVRRDVDGRLELIDGLTAEARSYLLGWMAASLSAKQWDDAIAALALLSVVPLSEQPQGVR